MGVEERRLLVSIITDVCLDAATLTDGDMQKGWDDITQLIRSSSFAFDEQIRQAIAYVQDYAPHKAVETKDYLSRLFTDCASRPN